MDRVGYLNRVALPAFFWNEECLLKESKLKQKVKDNDTGLTAFTFQVLRHICFSLVIFLIILYHRKV